MWDPGASCWSGDCPSTSYERRGVRPYGASDLGSASICSGDLSVVGYCPNCAAIANSRIKGVYGFPTLALWRWCYWRFHAFCCPARGFETRCNNDSCPHYQRSAGCGLDRRPYRLAWRPRAPDQSPKGDRGSIAARRCVPHPRIVVALVGFSGTALYTACTSRPFSHSGQCRDQLSQTCSGIGRPFHMSSPSGRSGGILNVSPRIHISCRECCPECHVVRSRNSCRLTLP